MPLNLNAHVFEVINRVLKVSFTILLSFGQMHHNVGLAQQRSQSRRQLFNPSRVGRQRNESLLLPEILVTGVVLGLGFRVFPRQPAYDVPHGLQAFDNPWNLLILD
jgi:hypothetical protein